MKTRLRKLLSDLGETFWLLPAMIVTAGILLALGLEQIDRSGLVPQGLIDSRWLYGGGGTGARTLLGAVASSTIGVAGTVFSITIAALSLAAGQMGPRLLRNFTRDRGNQATLGIFLGTFSYALMVLRSVRTQAEGAFVPHLSLSIGILLAFVCVGTLVYFVGHIAGRINVDTVIKLVGEEVRQAIARLAVDTPGEEPPPAEDWRGAAPLRDQRRGYLQHIDTEGLADWVHGNGAAIRLLVRPGGYVFPGAPIALVLPDVEGADAAIRERTALGQSRISSQDLEFAVRQLVEVAVRALSPGINDPHTAIGVLDILGAALCDLVPRHLPTGVIRREGRMALFMPAVDYDGLTDAMFHMIRQNASGSAAVLIRLIEVLTAVASAERNPARLRALRRHANLVLADAEHSLSSASDLADLRQRHAEFVAMHETGRPLFLRNGLGPL
ncbi:formate C-acetyltransferase glycine radical [Rhodospirillum rubrum]|uniref:DUF2254 domain-containing protein n=1 Tax=Rhodospirillum rubrum TaxID=1085 RepID=UPI001903E51C|nr:DUF2254 domain-containing protein [Rhodospirillum rubrum]MBK1666324.1 formate C-acetyltransferase glycine radical [Rhodospirillum rubrum]MBK1678444.1 formate C-acetyltransferase glycine radical [Rhodospirillum rubrum]